MQCSMAWALQRIKKKRQQPEKPTAGVIVADRVGFEPTSRLRDYLISSQGRYDHFDTYP